MLVLILVGAAAEVLVSLIALTALTLLFLVHGRRARTMRRICVLPPIGEADSEVGCIERLIEHTRTTGDLVLRWYTLGTLRGSYESWRGSVKLSV
jgi:hypothetical protein